MPSIDAAHGAAREWWLVDEATGRLWSVPDSEVLWTFPGLLVQWNTWCEHVLHASHDAFAFVNAEMLLELASRLNTLQTCPNVVLRVADGVFMYAQCVVISRNGGSIGNRLLWPCSYQQHEIVWEQVKDDPSFGVLRTCGVPIRPARSGPELRPSPRCIRNAQAVHRFEHVPRGIREMFALAPCAPFLFRYCAPTLKENWTNAHREKLEHPERIEFGRRRAAERALRETQRKVQLECRLRDPRVKRVLLDGVERGLTLMQKIKGAVDNPCESRDALERRFVFFGDDGLPGDLQSLILASAVDAVLANGDHGCAADDFFAMRRASHQFRAAADAHSRAALLSLQRSINAFVYDGVADSVVERALSSGGIAALTFRRLSCPPNVIMRMLDRGLVGARFVWKRVTAGTDAAELRAAVRAARAARTAHPPTRKHSEKMRELISIAERGN